MPAAPTLPAPGPSFLRRLAAHAGLPYARLTAGERDEPVAQVSPLAAHLLPEAVCREHRVLAVALDQGEVTLAAPDPFDEVALDVAQALLRRPVRVLVVPDADLDCALDDAFAPLAPSATGAEPARRLGELLTERELVAPGDVDAALREQRRGGDRIGELLVHAGVLSDDDLVAALAEQRRLPLLDVERAEPDPAVLDLVPEALARRHRLVALAADATTLHLAAPEPLDEETAAVLRERTGLAVRVLLAAPAAVEELARRAHGERWAARARDELRSRFPEESAARVLNRAQRRALGVLAVALVAALTLFPADAAAALVAAVVAGWLALLVHRLVLGWAALGRPARPGALAAEAAALDDRTLPPYTVLVPLHREANVVPRLVAALDRLDYPRPRLEVRLLCEEDDRETLGALAELRLPPHFRVVPVPTGGPRTKPRALAYGMLQARGELVAVFDAEDRPEPDQLRRAVAAFRAAPGTVACLQARLAAFNGGQSLLSGWFATEYATWFELVLPALAARGAPLPLGGSSNHLVAERLREIGGWDPFNVTEDADLGVRLHKAGLRTAMLDATTLEEAPAELGNWVRQRSRWTKGHLQTWLVHMRHPLALARRLGPGGLLAFHLTVGAAWLVLAAPVFWALTTVLFLAGAGPLRGVFPAPVFHAAAFALLLGNALLVLLHVAGALRRGAFALVRVALLAPLYWGLIAVAAWRGFAQLPTRPHLWETTAHGRDGTAG